jgi:hypothetical protein
MTNDPRSRSGSPPAMTIDTNDTIRARAEECQRIVDEAISKLISGPAFLERLKGTGATLDEARDYIEQYTQRRRDQEAEVQPTSHLPVYSPIRTFQIRLTLPHRSPGHCFVPRSIISSRLPLKPPQFLATPSLMSWQVFSDCLALKVPSLRPCLQKHHICPSSLTQPRLILTSKDSGSPFCL